MRMGSVCAGARVESSRRPAGSRGYVQARELESRILIGRCSSVAQLQLVARRKTICRPDHCQSQLQSIGLEITIAEKARADGFQTGANANRSSPARPESVAVPACRRASGSWRGPDGDRKTRRVAESKERRDRSAAAAGYEEPAISSTMKVVLVREIGKRTGARPPFRNIESCQSKESLDRMLRSGVVGKTGPGNCTGARMIDEFSAIASFFPLTSGSSSWDSLRKRCSRYEPAAALCRSEHRESQPRPTIDKHGNGSRSRVGARASHAAAAEWNSALPDRSQGSGRVAAQGPSEGCISTGTSCCH